MDRQNYTDGLQQFLKRRYLTSDHIPSGRIRICDALRSLGSAVHGRTWLGNEIHLVEPDTESGDLVRAAWQRRSKTVKVMKELLETEIVYAFSYTAQGQSVSELDPSTWSTVVGEVALDSGEVRLVRNADSGLKPGVYRSVDDDNDGRSWIWFCSLLEILAVTCDAGNEGWGRLIRVADRDGITHDWPMPMAMLAGDGNDYRRHLLSLGLELAPGRTNRDALQTYITVWQPSGKARCADRIGWNGQAFILPDAAIGHTAGEHVLLQTSQATSRFAIAGSLENWQENVAKLAIGNSRVAFAISASFAGPLLYHFRARF